MTSTAQAAAQPHRPLHPRHRRPEYPAREPDAPLFVAQRLEREAAELRERVLALVREHPAEHAALSVVGLLPRLAAQRDGQGRRRPTAWYSAVQRALELLAADGLITPETGGWRAVAIEEEAGQ